MQIQRLKFTNVWDSTPYKLSQAIRVRNSQDLHLYRRADRDG
jgi:hypothetical protein